jgi:hypothetical protein
MRNSKAWYGQVAHSKANTNIYDRKCPIWRPIRLAVSQTFLANVQNQNKLLLQIGKGRNYCFFLSSFLGCFLFIMMMMMKPCQKTKSHWRQFKGSVVDELLFIRLNYSN